MVTPCMRASTGSSRHKHLAASRLYLRGNAVHGSRHSRVHSADPIAWEVVAAPQLTAPQLS